MSTNDPGRRLKIFLCYASEDKTSVREVFKRLKGLGFDPWMDEEGLPPGAKWRAEIETRIKECDVAILFLSTAFVRKRTFVRRERELIIRRAEGITVGGTHFLIPAILGDVEIPLRLKRRLAKWQFLKLSDEDWDARLIAVLRAREQDFGIHADPQGAADPVVPPKPQPKGSSEPRPSQGQENSAPVVVLVPGFFGTALSHRDENGIRHKVWSTDGTALVTTLQDNPEWLERTKALEVGEVLAAVNFGSAQSFPLYEKLFEEIWSLGYDRGRDFLPFGYDWRLSIKTNAQNLADFLQENVPKGRPVKIIAHSMGGLIVRYMLATHLYQDVSRTVQSVIQIATPVLGSSRAYYVLKESAQFGDLCEWMRSRMETIQKGSFDLLKKAMNGFESVMELLPHDDNKILKTEGGEFYSALHPGAWRNVEEASFQRIRDVQSMVRGDGLPSVTAIFSVDIKTDHIYDVDKDFKKIMGRLSSNGDGVALGISARHGSVSEKPIEAQATHYVLPGHQQVLDIVKKEISRGDRRFDRAV